MWLYTSRAAVPLCVQYFGEFISEDPSVGKTMWQNYHLFCAVLGPQSFFRRQVSLNPRFYKVALRKSNSTSRMTFEARLSFLFRRFLLIKLDRIFFSYIEEKKAACNFFHILILFLAGLLN